MSRERAKKKARQRARAAAGPAKPPAPKAAPAATPAPAASARRPSRLEERDGVRRPDAIWAPFPLNEIGMFVGLVLFGLGLFGDNIPSLLAGVLILTVAVGELSLREHFSGYRSHSLLLALMPVTLVHVGVVTLGGVRWGGIVPLAIDLAIAGALAYWLQVRFRAAQSRARVSGRGTA